MKRVNEELNKFRLLTGVTVGGSKYLLLKNGSESPEEQIKLEQILTDSTCLRFAYELKEELREISETSKQC